MLIYIYKLQLCCILTQLVIDFFSENSEPNEHDSLVYEMKIKCTKKDLDALAHKQFISFPGKIVFTTIFNFKATYFLFLCLSSLSEAVKNL